MSSETRVKKLRGSGGYIMASVDDEQQRKGNLGGPDLFLAPMGRLNTDRISKYFCNTCEKDYEGSPKIEYENPNEEVAENLILTERGQYLCTTCGSTLAEYRDFKKPNESLEIGDAKPITPTVETPYEPPSTSVIEQSSPVTETLPTFDFPSETPTSPSIQSQVPPSGVSSIVGMAVYDEQANKVGTAKQIGIDSTQSLVLVVTKNDGNEVTIPWNQIKKVGQIVLLGTSVSTSSTINQQVGKCNSCGFANKAEAKFCEQCGTKI